MSGYSGGSVSGAGDVNGDGIDDVIIGASSADPHNILQAGESYVVFGSTTRFQASLDLATLGGRKGFQINGSGFGDHLGSSVSGAGDVNGDGIDDVIIGAPWADPHGQDNSGESYVVFGSLAGFPTNLDLADRDGSNGFLINGIDAGDISGYSVSGAGDVNGDGIDDLIIGAMWADPDGLSGAGESYVVFGSTTRFPSSLELATLSGRKGFQINSSALVYRLGVSVSGAGDVNSDGIDDLIIGGGSGGYVVFGQPTSSTEDEIEELIDEVDVIGPALVEPLERALVFLTDNSPKNDSGACGQLELFIRQVIAAAGSGDLTEEEAKELQEDAEEISGDLDCS